MPDFPVSPQVQGIVLIVMILAALASIWAVTAMILRDGQNTAERERARRAQSLADQREADTIAWLRDLHDQGVIFDADEWLARTADLPAVAPALVPLPEAGSIEPTVVLAPGVPLPDGEIADWVAQALRGSDDIYESVCRKVGVPA